MSLTLFTIEDYKPVLSAEALLIEEFKILHSLNYNKRSGDTQGRDRKRAIQECRYIYHMYDYRSEFSEYSFQDRHKEALLAADLPENYVISQEMTNCIEVLKKSQDTRMLRALTAAEGVLDKLISYFNDIDLTEKDDKGAMIHKPKEVIATVNDLGAANKKLNDLRKLVKQELRTKSRLRGDKEEGFDSAE